MVGSLRITRQREKLSLEELVIFYQISRHRGYRFGERNSKLADSILSKGVPSEGKINIGRIFIHPTIPL